jgi:hypothetical protein
MGIPERGLGLPSRHFTLSCTYLLTSQAGIKALLRARIYFVEQVCFIPS